LTANSTGLSNRVQFQFTAMIRLWCTEFMAIRVSDGELIKYSGPNVPGINWVDAQNWCHENAGHLVVIGELVEEVPCFENTYIPDFANAVNYQNLN